MVDSCYLNPLKCLNNGECVVNVSSNSTYCQCDSCYDGTLCAAPILQGFDTGRLFFIIYIVQLCLSILNNGLVLELFICCRRIRYTNCGIYLMIYSILSLLSSILSTVHEAVKVYRIPLSLNYDQYVVFRCYVDKIGYNTLAVWCIMLSSCIGIERGLIVCFGSKMNASRWRSGTAIIILFGIGVGTDTPLLLYKCDWNNMPTLQIARNFFSWFYLIAAIVLYVLTTLLVLISFARRIRRYGMEDGSYIKTFLKLLYTHLFIFTPPIAYGVSQIPYTISYKMNYGNKFYFQCGISTGEYILKVLAIVSTGVPIVVTWLLFVYPSRVYMTEFYLNTRSGQCLAKILLLFKSYTNKKERYRSSTTNLTINGHSNNELTALATIVDTTCLRVHPPLFL
jgi:hypothetical protein